MASAVDSLNLTPAAIILPTLVLITLFLDLPPLVWHIKNRNLAASNLIAWTILFNLFSFVNALIWPTDDIPNWFHGPVLCDIEAKLQLATTFGISGSLACIMRSLAKVLDTKRTVLSLTNGQRNLERVITTLLCFGGPVYVMAIHYVVQPTRYYIIAISGCNHSLDNSWPTMVLVVIWPVVLCLVAVYSGVLVLIRMRKYRRDFSSIISASNSNLTESRFQRLFFLSSALVLVYLPIQLYILYRNASVPLLPYSWELIHGNSWSDIILVPSHGEVRFDRWIMIVVGIFVFVFFGTGNDATKMYRKWMLKLRCSGKTSGKHRHRSSALHPPPFKMAHNHESLATVLFDFCMKRLSWRRSSSIMSEKDDAASVTTASIPSPIESEKFSKHETYMTGAAAPPQPAIDSWDLEAKPLPLVPARSQTSLFSYVSRTRESPPPDDIEAILRDYDAHQPNRFISGLWHANNANGNAAGMPAMHGGGIHMGNANGLRY
ncbi:MAG: hypothetical protein Q9212_007023 [Teloschistes hypoglaucus]